MRALKGETPGLSKTILVFLEDRRFYLRARLAGPSPAIAQVVAAVRTLTPPSLVAAAGGIAATYARASADVLVATGPSTAALDVAVNLATRQ